jgi:hypothetical protein
MFESVARKSLWLVAVTALALPVSGSAQAREVMAKQVSVGSTEASLSLEFEDGSSLDVSLRDGFVVVDDRRLGSFEPGGALDTSWRALLGDAIALEDGALATALRGWAPPSSLSGDAADIAEALDETLEGAFEEPAADAATEGVSISIRNGAESALARLLVGSVARLSLIEESLEGLGPRIAVHIEEDLDVPAGQTVEGTVVVIDGTARVSGEIRGDLVVVDGAVELEEGSRVTGELRLADSRVLRNQGEVGGGVVDVLETERSQADELRERLRTEIQDQVRRDLRDELRNVVRSDDHGFSLLSPVRSVVRGVGGVIEKIFMVLVLGLLGAAAVSFARPNLEAVADVARRAPARAAGVGLAGTFLLIPVWLLGAVALIVSIVGIPVAIAWLPLFPAAVVIAGLFGYLAVAKNAGEWLADSGYAWTDWIRKSNPVHTIGAGLVGLVAAFVVADLVSILPFFGFVSGLLIFLGSLLTFVAVQIGFGAVILTRAGRRRDDWAMGPDDAWSAAMDLDDDLDLGVDAAAGTRPQEGSDPDV